MAIFGNLIFQAERRRKLGLPPENPEAQKPATPPVEEKKVSFDPLNKLIFCSILCGTD